MRLETILWSALWSLILTLSHLIPFNIPVLLLFVPLTFVFPALSATGPEVTYGFAWLQIHVWWVWAVIFVWHFIVLTPIFVLFSALKPRKAKRTLKR